MSKRNNITVIMFSTLSSYDIIITNPTSNTFDFIAVMQAFMPGEITVLLKARKNLPSYLTLGGDKIGIRIPDSTKVLEFIEKVGSPLLAPSANKSGERPALSSDRKSVV